jgi:2-keto-4-pentenoate hydratase/2-oxohepta-3-ene-1,7-dioic acid hydratase in catechol pathway
VRQSATSSGTIQGWNETMKTREGEIMQGSRRDILKFGAAAALAPLAVNASGQAVAAEGAINQNVPVPSDGKLRLVSYAAKDGSSRLGAVPPGGRVVDIAKAAEAARMKLGFDGTSMMALIEAGPGGLAQIRELLQKAASDGPLVSELKLLPPIPKITRNIYAVGWNYVEHFEEAKGLRDPNQKLPEHPTFFSKAVNTLNGPFDPIPYNPDVSVQIDWECELAVVIGKTALNVAEADALTYVFGYTVMNDTTARDLQQKKHGGQWFKGKSLNKHGPMGPWIIPASELDHGNLHLILRVNGEVKQDATTQQMYFKVPRIISELSQGLTLEPGDIITTGTPPGVGYARNPQQFLKPGDVMESEIVEIGALRNTIQAV